MSALFNACTDSSVEGDAASVFARKLGAAASGSWTHCWRSTGAVMIGVDWSSFCQSRRMVGGCCQHQTMYHGGALPVPKDGRDTHMKPNLMHTVEARKMGVSPELQNPRRPKLPERKGVVTGSDQGFLTVMKGGGVPACTEERANCRQRTGRKR